MKRVANQDCRDYVKCRQPFKGSNLFGKTEEDRYVVYSYGHHWPLFVYYRGEWYENADRASVTTSKHRTQAHPLAETTKLPCQVMQDFAVYGWSTVMRNRLTGRYSGVVE